jgi:hypothetical protein
MTFPSLNTRAAPTRTASTVAAQQFSLCGAVLRFRRLQFYRATSGQPRESKLAEYTTVVAARLLEFVTGEGNSDRLEQPQLMLTRQSWPVHST